MSATTRYEATGEGERFKHSCNRCRVETWHRRITGVTEHGSEHSPGYVYHWTEENMIVQCQGCDQLSFQRLSTNSEDYDPRSEEYLTTREQYPHRNVYTPRAEIWQLPFELAEIYRETIKAFDGGLMVLTGQGIRNIVETFCRVLNVKGRDLDKKITKLRERSLITEDGEQCLHAIRELGNSATHSAEKATPKQVTAAFSVIDHMLEQVYTLKRVSQNELKRLPRKEAPVEPAMQELGNLMPSVEDSIAN
ncbi:DUF4145 domain-containing protein [Bacillus sp. NP157]|nr:DUF4145 domain-containing protein [Bacillus sp. NP157]